VIAFVILLFQIWIQKIVRSNIRINMPPTPVNSDSAGSRKRKAPIDDNGEPVTIPGKKVLGPRGKKQKADGTPTNFAETTDPATRQPLFRKDLPANNSGGTLSTKQKVRQTSPVEIEEIFDEEDHPRSLPPRNPRHILESEDDDDDDPPPPAMDVDDDEEEAEEDVEEEKEEDAEAELRLLSLCVCENVLNFQQNGFQKIGTHLSTCSFDRHQGLSTRKTVGAMCLNAPQVNVKPETEGMSADSLTKVMRNLQAICANTQRCAGVPRRWQRQTTRRICKEPETYLPSQN
jgi:hypothetical protein